MKQVITIHPDGVMSGLQVKPGKGVDLRSFGVAEIVRASEVIWSTERQAWFVLLKAPYNEIVSCMTVDRTHDAPPYDNDENEVIAYFNEYDDAVDCEIAVLNRYRLRGHEEL